MLAQDCRLTADCASPRPQPRRENHFVSCALVGSSRRQQAVGVNRAVLSVTTLRRRATQERSAARLRSHPLPQAALEA
jgi:hypothetical protein